LKKKLKILLILLFFITKNAFATNTDNQTINWFMVTIGFVGGLALFLYGLEKMSSGLQKASSKSLRKILAGVSHNRMLGFLIGALLTIVVQSSTATSVMLVSFVQAGLMNFSQTISIILGAYLGASITSQIIAFNISNYAILVISVGFGLRLFSKKDILRNIGDGILGFGLLFYGMNLMSSSMIPLRSSPEFIDILKNLENPIISIIAGLVLTALIHSSAAFLGILIILAQQNLISLESGIALVIGANVGTCITAIIASLSSNRASKRVAIVHTFFKLAGALIFVFWIPTFADFIIYLGKYVPANESQQIANAHTIFNLGIIVIFLPLTNTVGKLINKILPDKEVDSFLIPRIKYLDYNSITTPAVAINLAKAEINTMVKLLKIMFANIIMPFLNKELPKDVHHQKFNVIEGIEFREQKIDYLESEITKFLLMVGKQEINKEQLTEIFGLLSIIDNIERIADIINDEIVVLYNKMINSQLELSEAGKLEIADYHSKIEKQIDRLILFNETKNLNEAKKMMSKYEKYNELEEKYKENHFLRMNETEKSVQTHRTHMELLDYFKNININLNSIIRTYLKTIH